MESEPMLSPRGKFPLLEKKFSQEEDRTQDAASSRTATPTQYQLPLHHPGDPAVRCPPPERQTWGPPRTAADLGSIPAVAADCVLGPVIPVSERLVLQWLPCQAPGVLGSALGLVGPVSIYCDWVR